MVAGMMRTCSILERTSGFSLENSSALKVCILPYSGDGCLSMV
jgi:hypothetical protein